MKRLQAASEAHVPFPPQPGLAPRAQLPAKARGLSGTVYVEAPPRGDRGDHYLRGSPHRKARLGTFLLRRKKGPLVRAGSLLQPLGGPWEGAQAACLLSTQKPCGQRPSAAREELQKCKARISPIPPPGGPGAGSGLRQRSAERAAAAAETQGVGAGNGPRPGPGGGVQLGVEVGPGPGPGSLLCRTLCRGRGHFRTLRASLVHSAVMPTGWGPFP